MALVVERKILTGNQIRDYQDANGNRITGAPRTFDASKIIFESTNATVTFGANSIFRGGMTIRHDGCMVEVGQRSQINIGAELSLGASLIIGSNVNMSGSVRIVVSDGARVAIGDRCLFAQNISLRAYDNHPIFDLETRQRINYSRDINICSDVWVGYGVTVTGGGRIGHGSVIGTNSIVTGSKPIGEHVLAVGVPARVVREKIAWARPGMPAADVMDDEAHVDCLERLR